MQLCRYVDDLFAVDRLENAKHAMQCFARVVRALLGHSAIAEDKLCVGNPLEPLGIIVKINHRDVCFRLLLVAVEVSVVD